MPESAGGNLVRLASRAALAATDTAEAAAQAEDALAVAPQPSGEQQLAATTTTRRTLAARTAVYIIPAALSHFGPSIGIAVVDNLFGVMQGAKAIVLAQQKLWWMSAAAKYSAPVGATLGLFLGGRLADFFERLALRYSVHRVDSGAALAFVVAIAYIIRPR